MESQVSLDREVSAQPENVFIKDVITSETNHVVSNQPGNPAKKQTRQWAAWTRQEEESFFTALRQVGKNFEKITSRVQSKNKDQVRHYYYRLVRRMNKLLGPQLSLDAKNSKDTNAAMLRWWSLLEKHSCKASKLHLKPRRFKIFLETLEHQLLKDRKKNIRKRPFQGENGSTPPSHTLSNLDRASGHDAHIDHVHFDSQNIHKGSPVKPTRQRRRSGNTSTAAYKRWEKAAIAGVSLVADAAAHLERSALDKLVDSVQDIQGEKGFNPVAKDMPRVPAFQQNMLPENTTRPLMKLKLQLFPVDESTRRALEMDNHNPHLELTLSSRKKISSVLDHINRKWGSSSIASGELILLPYHTQSLSLTSCQKWTQDSVLNAGDVYISLGSPSVFRLRYGWFPNAESRSVSLQEPLPTTAVKRINMDSVEIHNGDQTECPQPPQVIPATHDSQFPDKFFMDKGSQKSSALATLEWADSLTNVSVSDLLSEVSHNGDAANGIGSPLPLGSQCLEQIPFTCDSFDAAIAAHVNKHLGKNTFQPSIVSSIWDAEETRDAFSFTKNVVFSEKVESCKENGKRDATTSLVPPVEKHQDEDPMDEHPTEVQRSDLNINDGSAKDLRALTDIYWPESLGPLDLDAPSCRYHSDDFILSDSLGGLNRLLTSSLDAFQNCSFFGLEHKEPASTTVGVRETASFSE